MAERLQKLISTAGIASRREAEVLIEQGRVTVNGKKAVLGDKADPAVDDVRVDGERISAATERVYIMLNKPRQVVTTVRSQSQDERDTVRDLVPVEGYLYPVGRLDADSEGLILLTNDGELAQRLTHPRYRHAKVYQVTVHGYVREDVLDIWRRGVMLDDGRTAPVEIKVLRREPRFTQLQVTMHEGRKRQIRRIGSTLGFPVDSILRTHLATLELGDLKPGEWRHLTDAEVRALRTSAMSGPSTDRPRSGEGRPPRRRRPSRREQTTTAYKRGEPGRQDAGSGESRPNRRPTEGEPRGSGRSRAARERGSAPGGSEDDRSRAARPPARRTSFERRDRPEGGDSGPRDGQDRSRGAGPGGARPRRSAYRGPGQERSQDRTPRSGARRTDSAEHGQRDERGPARDRRPFRQRSGPGPEHTERRDQRPGRPEGGERPPHAHGPDREQDQREQVREQSRPPRAPRNRPPGRDTARGKQNEPRGGSAGRSSGPGGRSGGRPGGPTRGQPGRRTGSRGPGNAGKAGGRGPRRGGR